MIPPTPLPEDRLREIPPDHVKRLEARASAWSLNDDTARLSVRLGDLRDLLADNARMREAAIDCAASLAAAISLLERSPKTAAPSNKMFDQMLADYRAALTRARNALEGRDRARSDGGRDG